MFLRKVLRSLMLLPVAGACLCTPANAAAPARVMLDAGVVVGSVDDSIVAFKGIPYAAPPVGRLRWRAPDPVPHWSGERLADDYGFSCMQPGEPKAVRFASRASEVKEDCLTLNVWAPAKPDAPLPIMVWIHGGGNVEGTSAQTYYDGSSFAHSGVVFVSLNYRLGVFGFFAHPALTREAKDAPQCNFALLDQLQALRWVQRNAKAFGGDPANVTVFGESAGGQDILALLTTVAAKGLFARAIVQSGGLGWGDTPHLADAEKEGEHVATLLGLPGAQATSAGLRSIPASTVVAKIPAEDAGPIVDGKLLALPILEAVAAGKAIHMPLIIGTNTGEGSILSPDATPQSTLPGLSSEDIGATRTLYARQAPDDTELAQLLFRDSFFAGPARFVAAHAAGPAYLYRFDYVLSLLKEQRRWATHGSEIPFVFESFSTHQLSEVDVRVQSMMHDCWVAFAKTGRPACNGVPDWPAYESASDRWMVLGPAPRVEKVSDAEAMDLLRHRLAPRLAAQ